MQLTSADRARHRHTHSQRIHSMHRLPLRTTGALSIGSRNTATHGTDTPHHTSELAALWALSMGCRGPWIPWGDHDTWCSATLRASPSGCPTWLSAVRYDWATGSMVIDWLGSG